MCATLLCAVIETTANVQKLQLDITINQLKRIKELVNSGVVPKGDLYEIEANLASQEKNLVDAQNRFYLSKISLAQLLLIDDFENFEIANETYDIPISDVMSKTPEEIFSYAVSNKTEIKVFETNLEIAKKDNSPYGNKTKKEIQSLSIKKTEFLIEKGCKIIVVACNTATTNSISKLRSNGYLIVNKLKNCAGNFYINDKCTGVKDILLQVF